MTQSTGDLSSDSPDSRPIRLGAIDIGTNSIRLVVAEVQGPDSYRVLDEERVQTRLGHGLYETGRLGKEPRVRSLAALGRMKAIADGFEVDELRAIATAALREAENGEDFVERARALHGIQIEIISEDAEAGLALRSVRKHFPLDEQPYVIVDIGGGSLEAVLVAGTVIDQIHSLPLGAIRLTERYLGADPIRPEDWRALRRRVDRTLKKRMGPKKLITPVMIGSGGTFTTFATMAMFERQGEAGPAQGYAMTRSEWVHLLSRLREAPLKVRRKFRGLSPERADIIVAGGVAVARLARRLGVRQILVNERGIRDGLLLDMISARFTEETSDGSSMDRLDRARAFARRVGSNARHTEHVARLAVGLFDDLSAGTDLSAEDRELLEAAAILHDAGYLIGHSGHHKHAYHLIMHASIPGFSARDTEIIANVVRYHRRALPKQKHANYARLDDEDRRRVDHLAGILRLADGLDRAHSQTVTGAEAEVVNGMDSGEERTIQISIEAESEPRVEIWDATRLADLLEKAFGVETRLVWNGPDGAQTAFFDGSDSRAARAIRLQK